MDLIDVNEATTQFLTLLERVEEGHQVVITSGGLPVAVLGPYDPEQHVATDAIINQLRKFRQNQTLSGLSIRESIEQDRH